MKSLEKKTFINRLLVLFIFFGFAACDVSSSDDSDTPTPQVRLNAVVQTNTLQKSTTQGNSASNHVQLTEAKFLIREIEFESALDQDSLDFVTEPMVLNFNLSGGITEVAIADIKPGVYEEVELDVHKPEDNETPPDPEFRIGSSGDERFSIILKGTVNGQEFIFRSRENFDVELEFPGNITIGEANTTIDITLRIDPSSWFTDDSGNELDPSNFNDVDEIEENIENSFEAFEDDDRDGEED